MLHAAPAIAAARAIVAAALIISAATGTACGGTGSTTPQQTLRDYENALGRHDADAARQLLDDAARSSTSEQRFEEEFQRRIEAGDDYRRRVIAAANADATIVSELDYDGYDRVHLILVDGQWRINSGVGAVDSRDTPRAAAVAFIRAVEAGDTTRMMNLVPSEWRARMSEEDLAVWMQTRQAELAEIVALLKTAIDTPASVSGDRATLRYGSRQMSFVRESNSWMIEDFD